MRTSLIVSLALTVGALLGYFGARYSASDNASKAMVTVRPITVPAPLAITLLSEEEAQQQRANDYESVRGLADVLSLPTQFAQTEALVALAGRSDINAISELIAAARGVNSDFTQLQLLNVLLSRFAELDSPMALDYLLSSGLSAERLDLLGVLFSEWAKTDLNATLRGVRRLSRSEHIQIAGDAILRAYAQQGEELAQEIVAQLPGEYDAKNYKLTVIRHLAASAPAEALEEALLIKEPLQRSTAVNSVLDKWAEQDARAAADQMHNLQDAQLKRYLRSTIVQEYVKQDPAAALEWIETNFKGREREDMLRTALNKMVQENPEQAITYLEKLPASQRNPNLLSNVASNWAFKHPAAAAEWVSRQDSAYAADALNSIARNWAEQNPEAAAGYVEHLPEEARQEWIDGVASSYAQRNPGEAIKWLQQYNAEQGYSSALSNVLNEWSQSDPKAVLAYVESQPDARQFSNAVSNSMWRLAEQDAAGAGAAVETMPEGSMRQTAGVALVETWADRDLQAADSWVTSLAAGTSRDRIVQALVVRLDDNPDRAVTLINSLQTERARLRSSMQFLSTQFRRDETATLKRIQSLDLPAARREQLRNGLRNTQQLLQ